MLSPTIKSLMRGRGWWPGRGGAGLSFLCLGILKQEWPVGNGQAKHIADDISNKGHRWQGNPDFLISWSWLCSLHCRSRGERDRRVRVHQRKWTAGTHICVHVCVSKQVHAHGYETVGMCAYAHVSVCAPTHLCPIDVLRSTVRN